MKKSTVAIIVAAIAIAIVLFVSITLGVLLVMWSNRTPGDTNALIPDDPSEEIFTKTIHDFKGYRVDNLDDDETTNFVVYAKGVEEIVMTNSVNVLEAVDDITNTYVFSSADKHLLSMKKGDVFFGYNKDNITESVVIKVLDISAKGDTVTVYGDDASLSDIFHYVDVNMPISVENMIVNPSNAVSVEVIDDSAAASKGGPGSISSISTFHTGNTTATPLSASADTKSASKTTVATPLAGWESGRHHVDFGKRYRFGFTAKISNVSDPAKLGFGGWFSVNGDVGAELKIFYNLYSADLTWQFDGLTSYFNGSIVFHGDNSYEINGLGSGIISADFLLSEVIVPCPHCPILMTTADLYMSLSIEGEIKGGVEGLGDVDVGLAINAPHLSAPTVEPIADYGVKEREVTIEEFETTVYFGPKWDIDFGVHKLATVGGEYKLGVEFKGECPVMDVVDPDAESKHGCDICIEGTADIVGRGSVGFDVGFNKEKRLFRANLAFPEHRFRVADFYLSIMRGGIIAPEFDWTKCPHIYYRTDVFSESGGLPHGNVNVTVACENGYTNETYIDINGSTRVYLPSGKATITAKGDYGDVAYMQTVIPEAPSEQTVTFDSEFDLFIICDYNMGDILNPGTNSVTKPRYAGRLEDLPELTSALQAAFPEAHLVSTIDLTNGDWIKEITPLGYSRGDIVILCEAERHADEYFIYSNSKENPSTVWRDIVSIELTACYMEEPVSHIFDQANNFAWSRTSLLNWWGGYTQFSSFEDDSGNTRTSYVINEGTGDDGEGLLYETTLKVTEIFGNGSYYDGDEIIVEENSERIYHSTSPVRAADFISNSSTHSGELIDHAITNFKSLLDPVIDEIENPTGRTYGELLGNP